MTRRYLFLSLAFLLAFSAPSFADDYRQAMRLHEVSMFSRSEKILSSIQRKYPKAEVEGFAVLSEIRMNVPGYSWRMERFLEEEPQSVLVPQIRYAHALNLFDEGNYRAAWTILDDLKTRQLLKEERAEYLFKKAYCCMELEMTEKAMDLFNEVVALEFSDYTAPSRYTLARWSRWSFQITLHHPDIQ